VKIDLSNKVALVTGGARDIGRAISLGLADAGASVVVNYQASADKARDVVKEITARGGKAVAVQADVSKRSDVLRLMEETRSAFGDRLDILVNNAGGLIARKSITEMDEAFWDARYGTADRIWSGKPNPQLVADTAELAPGRALDVGAGEGADAIWLAERGWTVDALDISGVALQRGRAEATARGADIAARIDWLHADVLSDELPAGPYDLVSLQFMHFSKADRTSLFQRCIAAVAPGGTLQVVAHHPPDLHTTAHRPKMPDFFYAADEVAELLDEDWTVVACDARPRSATDPHGDPISIHDAVLVARRS